MRRSDLTKVLFCWEAGLICVPEYRLALGYVLQGFEGNLALTKAIRRYSEIKTLFL